MGKKRSFLIKHELFIAKKTCFFASKTKFSQNISEPSQTTLGNETTLVMLFTPKTRFDTFALQY